MPQRLTLNNASSISDALGLAMSEGGLLLSEEECTPALFDLSTGIAGELFQKFTNYRLALAIVVANIESYGPRFKELAYEHKHHELIRFFRTAEEAEIWLNERAQVRT